MSKQKRQWFEEKPDLVEVICSDLAVEYPNLHFRIQGKRAYVIGSFPINHNGVTADRYLIEVEFSYNYPRGVPVVREIGGRIPWIADRHVFSTGVACLFFPYDLARVYPEGTSFLDFLDGPVKSYYVGQSMYEETGEWPFGQWGHNEKGAVEFFSNFFGTNDQLVIKRYIEILSQRTIKGHWLCPCGSGEKLRNCHLELITSLHQDYQYALEQFPWHKIKPLQKS